MTQLLRALCLVVAGCIIVKVLAGIATVLLPPLCAVLLVVTALSLVGGRRGRL